MLGLGILVGYFGYALMVWGVRAFSGTQDSFSSYILPFAPNSPSSSGLNIKATNSTNKATNSTAGPQPSATSKARAATGKGPVTQ